MSSHLLKGVDSIVVCCYVKKVVEENLVSFYLVKLGGTWRRVGCAYHLVWWVAAGGAAQQLFFC